MSDDYDYHTQPIAQLLSILSSTHHPSGTPSPLPAGGEFAVAFIMSRTGDNCVPLTSELPTRHDWSELLNRLYLPKWLSESYSEEGVVQLVVNKLPVPGDDVPLHAILDYMTDPETRRRVEKLDLWMRRATLSGHDLQDVSLEMEESLHDFAQHMRLADMRSQTSGIRMVLSRPLGIIEELLHLKVKGALDVVFEYQDRKATRMEAELSAPGGALAYIYEADNRFG